MRCRLGRVLVAACVVLASVPGGPACAQLYALGEVTFTFDHAALPVPHYALTVAEAGSAHYKATDATGEEERTVALSGATTAKLFVLVRRVHLTQEVCASKAKNVADTGAKTLSYSAGGTSETCSYNYSENKDVQQLTGMFQGIAETLDEGRTLERLHRYDRLGLDAEMSSYTRQVAEGDAIEAGAIASCLRSIADDPAVILRVRKQAAKLLAMPGGVR